MSATPNYFERLEAATHNLADQLKAENPNLTPEAVAHFSVALAIQAAGLAVAEALGGVQNSLDEIDGQLNTMGGSLAENTAGLVLVTEQVAREIDSVRTLLDRAL